MALRICLLNFYMINSLKQDGHLVELLRKGAVALVVRVLGAVLTFLLTIYIARLLGAGDFGIFMLALTFMNLVSVGARFGLGTVLLRQISASVSAERYAESEGYYYLGVGIVSVLSVTATVIVILTASWFSNTGFSKPELYEPLIMMAFFILPFSLVQVAGDALKACKRTAAATTLQAVMIPGASLVALFVGSGWYPWTLHSTIFVFVLAGYVALIAGSVMWERRTAFSEVVWPKISKVLAEGFPLLLAASGGLVMAWADTIVLGIYESSDVVGFYSAASRTAMVTTLLLMAVNAIASPKYSAMHANGDHAAFARLAQQTAFLLMILVIPPTLLFISFPEWVMGLYGDGFEQGASAFVILAIGQFINVSCGSVGQILSMAGHANILRNILLTTSMVNIILNVILVQTHGAVGVAYATAVSAVIWNVWMVLIIKKRLGFWVVVPKFLFDTRSG